jgi:hypothetical protein
MNHDAMMDAMLWVGALFVFTPILLAGTVIGVIWMQRRRQRRAADGAGETGP